MVNNKPHLVAAIDFLNSSEEEIVNQLRPEYLGSRKLCKKASIEEAAQSRLVYSLIKESLIERIQTGHFNLKERDVLLLPTVKRICGELSHKSYSSGDDLTDLRKGIELFVYNYSN